MIRIKPLDGFGQSLSYDDHSVTDLKLNVATEFDEYPRGVISPQNVRQCKTFKRISTLPTLYGQVTVEPESFDFGIVTSDVTVQYTVCNEYRYAVEIEYIEFTGSTDAITTSLSPQLPFLMDRLSCYTFTITVASQSPVKVIDGSLIIHFSDGSSSSIAMVGERESGFAEVQVMPATHELSFDTKITTSIDGTEYRVATRRYARERFTSKWYMDDLRFRNFFEGIDYSLHFIVPQFFYLASANGIKKGDYDIIGDFKGFPVTDGTSITIFNRNNPSEFEQTAVLSVTDTKLTLSAGAINAYECAIIAPNFSCTIQSASQTKYNESTVVEGVLDRVYYHSRGSAETQEIPTLNDIKVFNFAPQSSKLQQTINTGFEYLDYERGNWNTSKGFTHISKSFSREFKFASLGDYDRLVQFFEAVKGRYESFYMPTYNVDLISDSSFISDNFVVDENNLSTIQREAICVQFCDCRENEYYLIQDVAPSISGKVKITLDRDANIYANQIKRISYMMKTRFDSSLSCDRTANVFKTTPNFVEFYIND